MVQFTRSFFSLCLVAASFAVPTKRTVAQVEADIANIATQVTALDNDIKGFPASGLVGALNINTASTNLETTLNTATTDVKNTGAVDEADATTILNSVKAIQPVIIDGLTRISTEEPAFVNNTPFRRRLEFLIYMHRRLLPVAGIPALVLLDLQTLKTDTDAFGAALISAAPADLKAEATSILSAIDGAFATAIAAFS
ncbi:Hydrophobic surface binding protein [Mycena sanguinolenta]|uniref:Hydrophobic surface binding protein n=1 Tax=Mycena sanguinolenta TaxID=230812 RepID=A0A8H6Y024_9AGAR|nr:Hydrophobic surface binding protein [Mycena sanguinolenta]